MCLFAKIIWNVNAPQKVMIFIWLATNSSIMTWDNLQKRGWIGPGVSCAENTKSQSNMCYIFVNGLKKHGVI